MRAIAVLLIVLYQRYVSPYKGFRCAHAVYHAGPSCSAAVRGIIEREGLWRGWPLIRRRFAECHLAAEDLGRETEEEKRRRRRRRREHWGRNCDCGDACGEAACAPLDAMDCVDCSSVDCGGADCVPGDCSVSLFRQRPRGQSAQGS